MSEKIDALSEKIDALAEEIDDAVWKLSVHGPQAMRSWLSGKFPPGNDALIEKILSILHVHDLSVWRSGLQGPRPYRDLIRADPGSLSIVEDAYKDHLRAVADMMIRDVKKPSIQDFEDALRKKLSSLEEGISSYLPEITATYGIAVDAVFDVGLVANLCTLAESRGADFASAVVSAATYQRAHAGDFSRIFYVPAEYKVGRNTSLSLREYLIERGVQVIGEVAKGSRQYLKLRVPAEGTWKIHREGEYHSFLMDPQGNRVLDIFEKMCFWDCAVFCRLP